MKRFRISLFLVVIFLAAVPIATQTTSDLPSETVRKIESAISTEMAQQKIPGLSVAIVIDNQIRYAKGFGFADLENSVPAKAETAYRTASIAKSMTATAVMQLAEQGKLDLDAPIRNYCSAFPEKQWPVTARQLLGHLGGVRHYKGGGEAAGKEHYFSLADSLKIFKDEPLLHEPGTKFEYTTFGYSVLGCAIEGASGVTYVDYMRGHVFQPAGMDHTQPDDVYMIIPNRTRGYQRLDERTYNQLPDAVKKLTKVGEIYNCDLHDTSMKVPGGGLVSTAIDLVKFAIAIQNGQLIKKETLEQMWTKQRTKDGQETAYGLGWFIGEVDGQKVIAHSGGQAGTSTFLALSPTKGIAIGAMANLERAGVNRIVGQIREILLSGSNTAH